MYGPRKPRVLGSTRRPRVDQLVLNVDKPEARDMPWIELDHHVDIAARPEVLPQHRPEEGQHADMVPPAERADPPFIDGDPQGHTSYQRSGPVLNGLGHMRRS